MYAGTTLFAQVMDFLPWNAFHRVVARYEGNRGVRTLSCAEQYRVLAFARLTGRGSLRDIESSLSAQSAKLHDVNVLDLLVPEPGAFHVMDRAYLDFTRLNAIHVMGAFFVTRAKSNTQFRRRYSRPVDKSAGLLCDQTVVLTGVKSRDHYPQHSCSVFF